MKYYLFAFISIALFLASCSTGTRVTASWSSEPGKSYSLKSIAIIGIAKNPDIRKAVEDEMEILLDEAGFNTTGALMFLPPEAAKGNISREIVMEILNSNKFDGVITISLLRTDVEKRYVSGSYYYVPGYSTMPFYDYYGVTSSYVYAPGYYEESVNIFLETTLFSYPEGKVLWAAESETSPTGDLEKTTAALAKALVSELVESKTILP